MTEQGLGRPMAAGWYADPSMPGNGRWFDGSGWTNHVYVVPLPPLTPKEQRAAIRRAQGRGPALTVVGVLMALMGLMFVVASLPVLLGSSSPGDAPASLVFLLVGAGLLTTGVLIVVAPDKVGARLR